MNRITRNAAANIIGVHPQTITNWVNTGLINGIKENRTLILNKEEVLKYKDKLKIISISEDKLDKKISELKDKTNNIDEEIHSVIDNLFCISKLKRENRKYFAHLLTQIARSSDKDTRIIENYFCGVSADDLAEMFGVSKERIRQIIIKTINGFYQNSEDYYNVINENKKLKEQNDQLSCEISILRGQNVKPISNNIFQFQKPIKECDLSIRTKNVLFINNINTIGDILRKGKDNISNLHGLGRKGKYEIDDLLSSLGLKWSMAEAKFYAKGEFEKVKINADYEFGRMLYSLTENIIKEYCVTEDIAISKAVSSLKDYVERISK